MQQKLKNISNKLISIISSRFFFWSVIAFFVFQALWIALSFRYPMVYDERFHFGAINIYTDHWWPVIYNQPESYDLYRDFAGEGSRLFHFLMSFPQRFFEIFTSDTTVQIILHRILNITMVAAGLYYFSKLFSMLRIKQSYTNMALLVFSLLPITIFVAAAINYDNALFLLTPVFLCFFVDIIRSREINIVKVLIFVIIGLVASLMKFTFLPIMAVFGLIVLVDLFMKYKKNIINALKESFIGARNVKTIVLLIVALVVSFLFAQTYIVNVVRYGTPRPDCQTSLGTERCLANEVIRRNETLTKTKDDRSVKEIPELIMSLPERLFRGLLATSSSIENQKKQSASSPSILRMLFLVGVTIGCVVTIYSWRSMKVAKEVKYILFGTVVYLSAIIFEIIHLYYKYNFAVAVQSRYLIISIPIVIVLMVSAAAFVTKKIKYTRVVFIMLFFLLATQGGGLITHILSGNDSWYWKNQVVRDVNRTAKSIIAPLVKEDK